MPHAKNSAMSWVVYLAALIAYISAIWQRSSFGVAGFAATERFGVLATVLSMFVVVQLLTYSIMQVPAGLLADRFGSRVVIGSGAVIMALGQISLAHSSALVPAIVARVLIGTGDAMTFTSVIKLLPFWFSAARVPMLVQLTSMFGQIGQLLSTIPFAAFLRSRGWTPAFTLLAVVSVFAAVLAWTFVRNRPDGRRVHSASEGDFGFLETALQVWRTPVTRLGFFLHAVAGFPGVVFAMMWGYPYLEGGVGLSPTAISGLFTLLVVAGVFFGPLVGGLAPRLPAQNLPVISLSVAGANLVTLGLVLCFTQPPMWALALWMVAMSANAAGSNVGIEVARSGNDPRRMGTAAGVVIMGAFVFAVTGMALFGLALDLAGGYSPRNFRLAWTTQFLLFAAGFVGVWRSWARARMAGAG
ncbi:MFS transporter [Propionibacteriaceae bacterium Y1923]